MMEKPIRVFYSPISERFFAANRYKVEIRGDKELVTITGKKYDVTDQIAREVINHGIEFKEKEAKDATTTT